MKQKIVAMMLCLVMIFTSTTVYAVEGGKEQQDNNAEVSEDIDAGEELPSEDQKIDADEELPTETQPDDEDEIEGLPDGETEEAGTPEAEEEPEQVEMLEEEPVPEAEIEPELFYSAHVQNIGWQPQVGNGGQAGTMGKSLRMEAFKIWFSDAKLNNQIEYRAHVQNIGWQKWVTGGQVAGTSGKSYRVEAIQIRLKGDLAAKYDIYYTTHISNFGDLSWASNGESAGTQGFAERMEALKICLIPKVGGNPPVKNGRSFVRAYDKKELKYSGHIQNLGNVPSVSGGQVLGTSGKSYRIEGMTVTLDDTAKDVLKGELTYRLHVQNIGWQDWKKEGQYAGTIGKSLRVEAMQLKLTGEAAKRYNVYYRAHVQNFGWFGWASNGAMAGSEKMSLRMEAVQIVLVPKSQSQSGYINSGQAFRKGYVYQNPSQYLQIKHVQKTLSGGGYNLSSGYMGLKVLYTQRKLGLNRSRAIMDSTTMLAVRKFQTSRRLPVTGVVNLATWKAMGYSESQWYNLGAYAAKLKTNASSTRKQCIEAMISTAYEYLGTQYVIGAAGAPGTGIDCSGLVMQAMYAAGLDPAPVSPIRHSYPGYEYESRNLWNLPMKKVPYSQRQRGDLIFYNGSGGAIIHVAIYLGNDQVIESWPTKVVVWPIKNSHRANIRGVMRPFV